MHWLSDILAWIVFINSRGGGSRKRPPASLYHVLECFSLLRGRGLRRGPSLPLRVVVVYLSLYLYVLCCYYLVWVGFLGREFFNLSRLMVEAKVTIFFLFQACWAHSAGQNRLLKSIYINIRSILSGLLNAALWLVERGLATS